MIRGRVTSTSPAPAAQRSGEVNSALLVKICIVLVLSLEIQNKKGNCLNLLSPKALRDPSFLGVPQKRNKFFFGVKKRISGASLITKINKKLECTTTWITFEFLGVDIFCNAVPFYVISFWHSAEGNFDC